jgi:hypothetical protein
VIKATIPLEEKYSKPFAFEGGEIFNRILICSMDNVSISTMEIPTTNKKDVNKIVQNKLSQKKSGDTNNIVRTKNNSALVYSYDVAWIDGQINKKIISSILPEIYLLPYNKGIISVCKVKNGFIIRDGEDSGFRLSSQDSVMQFLQGNEYNLFYSHGSAPKNWTFLDISEKNIKKIINSNRNKLDIVKKVNRYVNSFSLITIAIILFWGWYLNNIQVAISENHKISEVYSSKVQNFTGDLFDLPVKNKYELDLALINKKKSTISKAFNVAVSLHHSDSFALDSEKISIHSKLSEKIQLDNIRVVYEP